MSKVEKKESLGFIFGCKETVKNIDENNKTSFSVKFIHGTSKKYPKKYEKYKDFYCQEVFVGAFSEIYFNPELFKQAFNHELKEHQENSFYKETFENRRYYFNYPITEEQYASLSSFSMAHLHMDIVKKWENESVLEKTLNETIGVYFKNDSRPILDIYRDYENVSVYIYNKEIEESLGEMPFTVSKENKDANQQSKKMKM